MIICVPVDTQGQVGHGWGRAQTVATAQVDAAAQISQWTTHAVGWDVAHDQGTHGSHHARIVRFLRQHQVECVVAEHMGPGMVRVMGSMGIPIFLGAAGDAREAVRAAAAILARQNGTEPPTAPPGHAVAGLSPAPSRRRLVDGPNLLADPDGRTASSGGASNGA
ncbi:MAG: hypothetical protein LBO20_11450 [Bifidobacteriaceae bacterium]|jgi:predicted Fe-Mo cluster-binding NifX family protein|nr:hypothetical protein [Bifidobacteriaceae bacterium]